MNTVAELPKNSLTSSLSFEELQVFKNLILKKIADGEDEINFLLDSIHEMRENNSSDLTSSQHHVADIGSLEAAMQVNMRLLERTQKFIRGLKAALKRIENGTYGVCKVTGKMIARERLMAAPHTQHSMEAKLMRNKRLNIG
ncbi:molecular chaperone DnaK [Rhodohalobacter sp. SW132]|uniref:TraR/DksA family transcriptional regulator n=1 Tax=Rhodohalobacter sp. SW132 TaxID=2293433 RepID=UPI000E27C696|nr:TraR/DksA C4-type zinc finger protein [Rhodohalobacter sp. SW132]REL25056.1 molecular chaperone DnaK [Rhodohalobacter sp. SW132]